MEQQKHSLGQAQGREAETEVQGVGDRRDRPPGFLPSHGAYAQTDVGGRRQWLRIIP